MKGIVGIVGLLLFSIAAAASTECLDFEPAEVSVTGTLVVRTYAGPPNYESVESGDAPGTAEHGQLFTDSMMTSTSHAALPDSAADALPTCRIEKVRRISFRTLDSGDLLKISVGPGPCYDAEMRVEIATATGHLIYSYAAPFKQHVAIPWDHPDLDVVAQTFVENALQRVGRSNALPESVAPLEGQDQWQFIKVPEEEYQSIRNRDVPTFTHNIHYEAGRTVVFDPGTGLAVVVLDYGT